MPSELTRYEDGENMSLSRPPHEVLAEAKTAAKCLIEVITQKPNPVKFNGEIYLELEDWQTVAKFYGCTAKVTRTEFVNYGEVKGFDATAVVIDRRGNEISSAESMCLNDEPTWGAVPKYEWHDELDAKGKKVWDADKKRYRASRVQVGTEPKPLFQLKSMAQTRACAKALRLVFSWVVVLAGYKPTVAEEMTGNELPSGGDQPQGYGKKPAPEVQRKSEKTTGGFPAATVKKDPATCSECRVLDGHADACPYHPSNLNKSAASAAKGDQVDGKVSREDQWKAYPGHDPKLHISFKQGALLFVVQSKVGISEESMKEYLVKNLNTEHRPLITKENFAPLLDAMDPSFEYHVAPKEG